MLISEDFEELHTKNEITLIYSFDEKLKFK
jgi:hypothetical protein